MDKPKPFMYIIREGDKESGTAQNSYFRLNGLPTQFKSFDCEVVGFYHNLSTAGVPVVNTLVELITDMPFQNGYETNTKRLTCIATNSMTSTASFEFRVENFNGRTINFTIYDNDLVNINDVDDWVLYLKMTGIKE